MAATGGSVAVGSTIGHGLSSMLFGGSSLTPAAPVPATDMTLAAPGGYGRANCEVQAKGACSKFSLIWSYNNS